MLKQITFCCAVALATAGTRFKRTFQEGDIEEVVKRSVRSIDPPNGSPRSARSYDYDEYDQEYQTRNSRSPQGGYGAPPPQASYGGGGGGGAAAAPQPLMPYRYGYAVQDDIGNDFNQQEQSDGDQITGQYSVVLPDCRVQTVTYSVRPETGYVAEVSYSDVGGNCIPAPPGIASSGGGGGGGGGSQASYGSSGK